MAIVIEYDRRGMDVFRKAMSMLDRPTFIRWARQSLGGAGDKSRTQVRKALRTQMGTKGIRAINANTSGSVDLLGLAYTLRGVGKGLPIEEFPVRASKSLKALVRWHPREHWKLQVRPRQAGGRFSPIPDEGFVGGVTASPWRVSRTFQRSYVSEKGYRARTPDGRTRKLYGPAIGKEIIKDHSLATWEATAIPELERQMVSRLARLVP